ncbi:cell envelope integrity protein TolA [Candidatus Neoehrlichia procyonis]|uniref:Protein TolA n=1 Tax=Candidatus Neoehrlichia procyonis str. RAC413 TaxID=1359163 RepID=A0A0F3NPF2_9RICK|nr:cell envelope integrity protein TolA [Candidatus Neoehrlichia lotoris]KJV69621.1 protein TolA [Candidatus Neoehrlichia lotoris str. RAC413]
MYRLLHSNIFYVTLSLLFHVLITSFFFIKLPNLHLKKNNLYTNHIVVIDALPLNTINNIPLKQTPPTKPHHSNHINKLPTKNNTNQKKHTTNTASSHEHKKMKDTEKKVTKPKSNNKETNTASNHNQKNKNATTQHASPQHEHKKMKDTEKKVTKPKSNNKETNTASNHNQKNKNVTTQHASPQHEHKKMKDTEKKVTKPKSNNKETNTASNHNQKNKNVATQHASPQQELASILKSIEKSNTTNNLEQNNAQDGLIGKGDVNYDKNSPVSIKILDAIRSKFIKCWTVPAGAKNIGSLQVIINVALSLDGKVINAEISDQYSYAHDHFFRAIADSALRAVYKCSPLIGLSKKHYNIWNNISLNFDPRHML